MVIVRIPTFVSALESSTVGRVGATAGLGWLRSDSATEQRRGDCCHSSGLCGELLSSRDGRD